MPRSELTRVFARSTALTTALALTGLLAWACGSNDGNPDTTDGGADSASVDDACVGCGADASASNDSSTTGDADADAATPACGPDAAFGAPSIVTELSSAADEASARLLDDGLTVYVTRGTAGGADHAIYVATRATTADAFGALTAAADLVAPTSTENLHPTFTSDGLTVVWQWNNGATPHLARATRATKAVAFGAPTTLTSLDSDVPISPWLSANGDTLWYGGQPAMSSPHVLVQAPSPFNAAGTVLYPAAAFFGDGFPALTRDGLTIYFASDRGTGFPNIRSTERASTADTFAFSPIPVTPLFTSATNLPTWISPDGCTLYFSRSNGTDGDIYRASRGP